MVPWGEVDQRYSYLTPAQVRDLVRPGRLLFAARDRSYGLVALYELPLAAAPSGVAAGRPGHPGFATRAISIYR